MEEIRCLKIYSEKIRGLKILGFSEENTNRPLTLAYLRMILCLKTRDMYQKNILT